MIFGEIANFLQGGFVADGIVENRSLGVGGANDRRHDFDECGFASAVGPKQPKDFPAIHGHVDAAQGVDAAFVNFGHLLQIDCEIGGSHDGRITQIRRGLNHVNICPLLIVLSSKVKSRSSEKR